MRKQSDGSLVFPVRGDPPAVPTGYIRDCLDPWRMILMPKEDLKINCYQGLGDNIYHIAIVKYLMSIATGPMAMRTCWPEIFWWTKAKFYRIGSIYRTQKQNEAASKLFSEGEFHPNFTFRNTPYLRDQNFITAWEMDYGLKIDNYDFTLPIHPDWDAQADALGLPDNTLLVHCPTLRFEWLVSARNPEAKYFNEVLEKASKDFYIVSVNNTKAGVEVFDGRVKHIHKHFDHGELHYTTIFALAKRHRGLFFPSFFLPMYLAMPQKGLCLYGGHLPPHILVHPKMTPLVKHVTPNPFSRCNRLESDNINKELDLNQLEAATKEFLS